MKKTGLILFSGLFASITIASLSVATKQIPPATLSALRLAIASAILVSMLLLLRPRYIWQLRRSADLAIIGLLSVGLPSLATPLALRHIPSSLVASLLITQPMFTLAIAQLLLKDEKMGLVGFAGAVVSTAGAAILVLGSGNGVATRPDHGNVGQLLIVGGSLSAAAGIVYARIRLREEDTAVLAAGPIFVGLALIAPLAVVTEGVPAFLAYPSYAWAATVIAAVGTVVGYWLVFYIITKYGASVAGLAGIATPLFSVMIGVAFLGEGITLPIGLGTLMLLLGVYVCMRSRVS